MSLTIETGSKFLLLSRENGKPRVLSPPPNSLTLSSMKANGTTTMRRPARKSASRISPGRLVGHKWVWRHPAVSVTSQRWRAWVERNLGAKKWDFMAYFSRYHSITFGLMVFSLYYYQEADEPGVWCGEELVWRVKRYDDYEAIVSQITQRKKDNHQHRLFSFCYSK